MTNALNLMLKWFDNNGTKASPDTFLLIFHKYLTIESIVVNDMTITHQPSVKLLGIRYRFKFEF